jgi:putative ABC transport system permease protein
MSLITFLSPRWRKVARDIWDNKTRTILVVLAVAVGVFAFGGMFITQTVLLDNMNRGFSSTNPATITVTMSPFDESLVRTARTLPYVQDVGARATAQVQVWTGDAWLRMDLTAAPDFEEMSVNRINLERGSMSPARREVLLERQTLTRFDGVSLGDPILVELPDGTQRRMTLTGVVHDFNAIPASRIPLLTGYVSLDTLNLLGLADQYSSLEIVTPPSIDTQAELDYAADVITDRLERDGYIIQEVSTQEPGKHWASDFIEAVVLVLIVLGLLALGLSGLLVVNTLTAILTQQKRQIGMMKAVGARTRDVLGIYLVMAGVFGALALVIALPVSIVLSTFMTQQLASFLNVDILTFDVPGWILFLQAGMAVVTPLVAAFIPVVRGTRTTVREAIDDYGLAGVKPTGWIDRLISAIKGLSRPVLLTIRNTFRRKGRLVLTVTTLSVAGAIFIAVFNTRTSMLLEFDQILAMFGYDVQVILTEPQPVSRLVREAQRVDGVEAVEGWAFAFGTIVRPEGVQVAEQPLDEPTGPGERPGMSGGLGTDEEGTNVIIFAPPSDTEFIEPTMLAGRWMQPGDEAVIVLSSEVLNDEPYLQVGDVIDVKFGDDTRHMELIGVVNLTGAEFAYAPFEYVSRVEGAGRQASAAMLRTASSDIEYQERVARAVEDHFQQIGIRVAETATPASFIGVITSQIDFFVLFMLFMALLLGLVGGLGLATTMSLNVLERTREIGVMRAIGASDRSIWSIFLSEGVLIGLISYVIALALSIPITIGFEVGVGYAFFDRPLELAATPLGVFLWLATVLVISSVASLLPSQRAASVSVRESIAYE